MLIYLSGPMTGHIQYNFQSFQAAAARLREQGYEVLNPAETAGGCTTLPRVTYMRIDMGYVSVADAVCVLPGWHRAEGAKLEVMEAQQLEKPIHVYQHEGPVLGERIRVHFDTEIEAIE